MNAKNVILFLIVILIIVGGLYLIQDKKQDKELISHNTQRLKQITKVAQKSSHAGLLEMASALNKFHKIKGHYPNKLIDLYPEFIPEKPFISTLQWKYFPEKGNYLLQKTVAGKQMVSSIGPTLKLKTGNQNNRIVSAASAPQNKRSLEKTKIHTPPKTTPEIKNKTTHDDIQKGVSSNTATRVRDLKIKKVKKAVTPQQSFRIVKKELSRDEKYLLSFEDNRFYIWKGNDGFIGFSDTQYPDENELFIYRDKGWLGYSYSQNSSSID